MCYIGDILLDCICELGVEIHRFVLDDEDALSFKISRQCVKPNDVLVELLNQYNAGYISFRNGIGNTVLCHYPYELEQPGLFAFLTEAGGERWERTFHPKWKDYISATCYPEDNSLWNCRIESGSDEVLETILSKTNEMKNCHCGQVRLVSPWNVTYWKRLENGYVIDLELSEEELLLMTDIVARIRKHTKWKEDWHSQ